MKDYAILVKFSGSTKRSREVGAKIARGVAVRGYTESKKNPLGFKVWVNSKLSDREQACTFFHEMGHVFCRISGVKYDRKTEEFLCERVGYLSKIMLSDAMPEKFGKKKYGRRTRDNGV